VNFDLLPMEHVSRVELLSGSGSLLGANSLGGAINLDHSAGHRTAGGRAGGLGRIVRGRIGRGIGLGRHAGPHGLLRRGRL
jgi:hypothetical protein